jgi:hypothetical protein
MARLNLRVSNVALVIALTFSVAAAESPSAFAMESSMPDISVFAHATPISDGMLAHMRGRGILNGQIVQFGVEMFSKWRTDNGNRLKAAAVMTVSGVNSSRPQVSFQPSLTFEAATNGNPSSGGNTQSATGGNSIRNVSGVGQSIQIAGNSNSITNSANVTVTTDSISTSPESGSTDSLSKIGPDGSTLSATLDKGGVGVSITTPQGQVMQQIKGGPFGSSNSGTNATGLVQMVQATGNMQQIENVMNLRIQLSSLASLTKQSNFNQTLNTLRGIAR